MMKRLIKIDTDYGYKKAVEVACNSLKQGKVIAIPTDTIYGVCCSLTECSKIYDIKERNQTKPLGIFVPDIEAISMVAIVPEEYKQLVDSLLPGPCTLLLPRSPLLPKSFNPGVDSVGVRIPDCKFVQDLVKQFGEPIAQTSANKSGASVNPTSINDFSDLWPNLDTIVDGDFLFADSNSNRQNHPGSTIIDLTQIGYFSIIREGIMMEKAVDILSKSLQYK